MTQHRVCPWWIGYGLLCPLVRWGQNPRKILAPYVQPGSTVLEPGPGMGFFTLELGRLVGPTGRVVAVDIQPKMLERLKHRVDKAGLLPCIEARLGSAEGLAIPDLRGKVDFTLAFAMVHETLDVEGFFAEVADASKPGASILFAEPSGHVKEPKFESELRAASDAGFRLVNRPAISRSHAALLQKN